MCVIVEMRAVSGGFEVGKLFQRVLVRPKSAMNTSGMTFS